MIIKTLIGAVTRAFEPGSQLQTVLTLQGNQGAGKSEFFAALFGKDFFGHLNSQGDKRDWSMCLGQTWAAAPCISKEVRSYQRNQGVQPMNNETDLRRTISW